MKFACGFGMHEYIKDGIYLKCKHCGIMKLIPCNHNYKIIDAYDINDTYSGGRIGKLYIQQCNCCGHINKIKVSI